MLQQQETLSLDQWRELARAEIRALIATAEPDEKTTHLRRRLERENPIRAGRGGGITVARIRHLVWLQLLYDELAVREAVMVKARAYAELRELSGGAIEPTRKRRERLKLVGRNRMPTR